MPAHYSSHWFQIIKDFKKLIQKGDTEAWIRDKKHQQNKNIHLFIYHVGDTEASQYFLKHIISISVANNGRAVAQCRVCS